MPARALAAACFLLVAALGRVAADDDGISASLVLTRTMFLSSEKPVAILSVSNHSSSIVDVELGSVMFQYRSGGQWQESLACRRDCYRWVVRIQPAGQVAPKIELPTCDTLPSCTEDVIVRYDIRVAGALKTYRTRLPLYRIVPDPTATYDVDGLKGNRPVFVSYGSVQETIFPSAAVVAMDVSHGIPSPYDAFANAGVPVSGYAGRATQTSSRFYAYVDNALGRRAALNSTLLALRRTPGFQNVSETSAFDPSPLWNDAEAIAREHAKALAELVRVDNDDAWQLDGRLDQTLKVTDARSGRSLELDDSGLFPGKAILAQPAQSPITVGVAVRGRYVGANPASTTVDDLIQERATDALRWPANYQGLTPAVTIVTDRPELYTIGASFAPAARSRGLSPEFAALVGARSDARRTATVLGVSLGPESLFVDYPIHPGDDYPHVGLATTFAQGDAERWRGIRADPQVRAESYRSNPLSVPIDVAHPDATMSEYTYATPSWQPDLLRFRVDFNAHADEVHVDGDAIVRRLRRIRGVVDAAGTIQIRGHAAGYDVILKASDRHMVPELAAWLKSAYATADADASFDLAPFVGDCEALEPRLMRAAIRSGMLHAQADARAGHRVLRTLLLVAVLPTGDDGVCGPVAQPPGSAGYIDPDHFSDDDVRTIPIGVQTLMVFRTGS